MDRTVRRVEQEGPVREQLAHDRASILTRHADHLLLRAGRSEHGRDRDLPERYRQEVHAGPLPRRGCVRQSRHARVDPRPRQLRRQRRRRWWWRRTRRWRRWHRTGAGVGRWAERVLCRHAPSPQSQRGRPEDVHRQGRDQDRRQIATLRKQQRRRLRASHVNPRHRERQVHRREGESRPRWRRTSWPRGRSASS